MFKIQIMVGSWLGNAGLALAKAGHSQFKKSETSIIAGNGRLIWSEIAGILLNMSAGTVLGIGGWCLPSSRSIVRR
jgi:hypothetical protein